MGGMPERLWVILAHVYDDEDQGMMEQLRTRYQIARHYSERGAAAYLLISVGE